jgi:hypothetical protein
MTSLDALQALPPDLLKHALASLKRRVGIEGSKIARGLYQGQAPPAGPELRAAGFDTLILCAAEWQPPHDADLVCSTILGYTPGTDPYPGVTLFHAPADDDFDNPPSAKVVKVAAEAASFAARQILRGGNVLVSCWAGVNRSGLVTGLTLHGLTGLSGAQCIARIRGARPKALTNPQFVAALAKIQGARQVGVTQPA